MQLSNTGKPERFSGNASPRPHRAALTDEGTRRDRCLEEAFPENRSGFPVLLNCMGLTSTAVEVGVQAGVHASNFLKVWQGHHLRLVDLWAKESDASPSRMFYVDIANILGKEIVERHRQSCEARHDFAGVVADIHAWWPKVRIGGIFAGHDFVDGEFPEGDFFWVSALREVLPTASTHAYMTSETNR